MGIFFCGFFVVIMCHLLGGLDACTFRQDLWLENASCRQIRVNPAKKSGQILFLSINFVVLFDSSLPFDELGCGVAVVVLECLNWLVVKSELCL